MKRREQRTQRFDFLARSAAGVCRSGPGKSRWLPLHPLAPGNAWGGELAILWSAKGDVYQVVLRAAPGRAPQVVGRRAPRVRRGEVHGVLDVRTGTAGLGAEVVERALAALLRKAVVARPGRRVRLRREARRWSLVDLGSVEPSTRPEEAPSHAAAGNRRG